MEITSIFNVFIADSGAWDAVLKAPEWLPLDLDWIAVKLRESPAAVIALAALVLFPALAVTGALVHRARPAPAGGLVEPPPPPAPHPSHSRAVLEVALSGAQPFPIRHGIVRIGRETDNDVRLDDPTVHRYHAVIERTPDGEFRVAYVGDPEGNGLRVNGQRVLGQILTGGEILDIGAIKLRFTLTAA